MSTQQKWKELCAGVAVGVVLGTTGMALINKLIKEDKKENKSEQTLNNVTYLQWEKVSESVKTENSEFHMYHERDVYSDDDEGNKIHFDFIAVPPTNPERLIKKMKEHNANKEGELAFENSKFKDRNEEIEGTAKEEVATKQPRAPKSKAPKRTVSRDALAARVVKAMEARKGRKG